MSVDLQAEISACPRWASQAEVKEGQEAKKNHVSID